MGADRYFNALASPVCVRHAAILIDVVVQGLMPLALGEVDLGAKGKQRRRVNVRRHLIFNHNWRWSRRFGAGGDLQSISIEKAAASLDLKIQRTDWRGAFTEIHPIVQLLAHP